MKKLIRIFLVFILFIALFPDTRAVSQVVRGKALYDLMDEDDFAETEGLRRVNWLPEGNGYFLRDSVNIEGERYYTYTKVNAKNGKESPLFKDKTVESLLSQYNSITGNSEKGIPFRQFDYIMDNKAIFFTVDKKDFVYDLKENKLRKMNRPKVEKQPNSDDLMRRMRSSQLWKGTYSDDYKKFAYVKGYDLYIVDTYTGREKRLTYGSEEKMNGRPSWVYPEEFGQTEAYWFSPDNKKIAYLQYNEKDVYNFPIVHELNIEVKLELERYPKPGKPNPTVRLFVVDVETGENIEIPTNPGPDTYIVRPIWKNDCSELTFRRMNRRQNRLELLAFSLESKQVRTILTETEDCYVRLHDNFIQLSDNERFLWTSERTGYNHIYLYDFDGTLVKTLTEGEWPVRGISELYEKDKIVYFTGYQNMGLESYFYSVKLDGSKFTQLTKETGQHSVSIDPAIKYYTDSFSSLDSSPVTNIYEAKGKLIRQIAFTNIEKVKEQGLVKPEMIHFKAADGVSDLVGLIFKPVNFDPNKKYPLIVPLYGGPGSQDARNSYQTDGNYQRLAQLGFIVLRMNYRGSGNRGKKFQTMNYMKLGQVEMDDYAEGVKFLRQRPYVDGTRVGVYGGSYGGYSTCMLMLRYPDVFTVGVAGSSVTDWRNYDSIYTERYMRTPQENPDGYDKGSAMTYAENLRGKLLLTHGTIDNNVHPSNTIQLINAFIEADKDFDLMLYPEHRHGIRGAAGEYASRLRMDYFVKHLKPETYKEYFKNREDY
ncbi:MAG: prolyl oligopeptidase family serine peptidase [bacterium]|nr:prolyl oligopeptidase family serine peptidase [bacterium]